MLVRALANLAMLVVPGDACYFVTPEQGVYSVADPGDLSDWAHALFDRIEPLATSRLVIDNRFDTDLEPELWDGDELTEELYRAGRRLDKLGLLPAPFPLEEIVGPDEFNYPCGTAELAGAVADIIRESPEPGRCVVGLKNHGLTITGPSLDDIFERIEPVIEVQVPMIA